MAMLVCPNDSTHTKGLLLPPGKEYCPVCGAELGIHMATLVCSNDSTHTEGLLLSPDDKYCRVCGAKLRKLSSFRPLLRQFAVNASLSLQGYRDMDEYRGDEPRRRWPCRKCHGRGVVEKSSYTFPYLRKWDVRCPECDGTGVARGHDANVRQEAAEALGKRGKAMTLESLLKDLKDKNSVVRWNAAEALGKMGDASAVGSLIDTLRDEEEGARWASAEALGKIGDARAVEPLMNSLKDSHPTVRLRAAEALGRIGDAKAVDSLNTALGDSSTYVCRAAAEALGRLGVTRVIEPHATKPAPVIEQEYVNDCLRQKYEELPETRSWNSDPAFKRVLDPLNSGHDDVACHEAEAVVGQFRDFSNLYDWWGAALLRMGSLVKARQVLNDGLVAAREKYLLCNRLGEAEWKDRDLKTAVYWWAQGLQCQESLSASNYGGSVGAYLYLHYVAEGLHLPECSKAFLMRVDSIRPGMIRLNPESANDLIGLARSAGTPSIEKVLKELVEKHIIPREEPQRGKPQTKADSDELRRLISELEGASQSRWVETDVRTIERLGELGDPQAIDVLTRIAAHSFAMSLGYAAEKAIAKIRNANQ